MPSIASRSLALFVLVAVVPLEACRHGGAVRAGLVPPRAPRDPRSTELVTQTGHHAAIDAIAFAPSGRLLATGGGDRLVKLWDLGARRELDAIEAGAVVNAVALSPDGRTLAVGTGDYRDGTLALYDVEHGALLGLLGGSGRKILALAFSPDGRLLASGGAGEDGPELIFWDVSKRTVAATLRGHREAISALGFTSDGKHLVTASWDFTVKVWSVDDPSAAPRELGALGSERARALAVAGDLAVFDAGRGELVVAEPSTGREVRRISGAGPLTLSPDAKTLACVAQSSGTADIRIFELPKGTLIGEIPHASELPTPALAFDASGRTLATGAFGGDVRLWQAVDGRPLATLSGPASYFVGAAFVPGSKGSARLVSLGGDSILSTWDLVVAERTASLTLPRTEGSSALALAAAAKAPRVLAADRSGRTWVVDVSSAPTIVKELSGATEVASIALSADGRLAALGTNRGKVLIHDVERDARVEELALEPLASSWAVAFDPRGGRLAAVEDDHVVLHALGTSEVVRLDRLNEAVNAIAWSEDGARIAAGTFAGQVAVWRIEGNTASLDARFDAQPAEVRGKVRGLGFDASGRALVVSGDGAASVWDVATHTRRTELTGHTGGVPSATFGADDRVIATAGWDGTIRVHGATDGKERARLVSLGLRDFVVSTPSNHYRASRGGLAGVAFRHQDRIFPFEQFDLALNRPDLVLASLGLAPAEVVKAHAAAFERRKQKLGHGTTELGDALDTPELRLLSAPPLATKDGTLHLEVLAEAPAHGLDHLAVWANDVPVFGSRGLDVKDAEKTLRRTLDVTLVPGVNKLQLAAIDRRGVESLRETFVVRYDVPRAPRDLYLVLVGVSDYGDPERNLGYPAKDVNDLAALFRAKRSDVREVRTTLLVDRAATRAHVLETRALLEKSRPEDQVIVFVAGHGLVDDAGNYVFATADIDFDRPAETGLAFDAIEGLLDGIPAREKLLLVDTCHAGELSEGTLSEATARIGSVGAIEGGAVRVRGLRSKSGHAAASAPGVATKLGLLPDLFADLRRGSGATVIAAAGGAELAYESPAWNNGVFTYAVVEGLRTKKADVDGDGAVRASELKDWVTNVVERLTLGVQVPTTRRENIESDFRVY